MMTSNAVNKEMPPEMAKLLFDSFAFAIFKDFPEGIEIGIDYSSFRTGPKFLGIKLIPRGVHFIYISYKDAPRIGFFHHFKEREIMMKKWDKKEETFIDCNLSSEEEQRIRLNLKNIDKNLGAYPFATLKKWTALSHYVDDKLVEKLNPNCGRITSQTEFVTQEQKVKQNLEESGKGFDEVDRENPNRIRFTDEAGMPVLDVDINQLISFTNIPQITIDIVDKRAGVDNSVLLNKLLQTYPKNKELECLLGEFQYSFIVFLIGQVYEGFDQWKRLLHLLCSVSADLPKHATLYDKLFLTIYHQITTCPDDFFKDIMTADNFINSTLSLLFANIEDNDQLPTPFKGKAAKTRRLFEKKFNCSFNFNDA
uniref:Protein AAR2 homolog n=1 Tax=Rhabditophanes sp. KR3021 TaxID=114890 RepID=A0AC35TK03_9BILA